MNILDLILFDEYLPAEDGRPDTYFYVAKESAAKALYTALVEEKDLPEKICGCSLSLEVEEEKKALYVTLEVLDDRGIPCELWPYEVEDCETLAASLLDMALK